jgi:putative ABC transport system substrate-binding protein
VQVQSLTVQGPDDLEGAFKAATRMRADALLTLRDPLTSMHRERIADFAMESRLPSIYSYRGFVDAGGLMSYGASIPEMFRRAAVYVDKILKGARPGELPVEQSTSFELVINLKTAKALGITMPPSLLILADEVIK